MAQDTAAYLKRDQQTADRVWALQIISSAQLRGFYGKLTLVMKNGKLVHVVKEESLVPPVVDNDL